MSEKTREEIRSRYVETGGERIIEFSTEGGTAVVAQNRTGYAMVSVRDSIDGPDLERYYGLDMALDHAAELIDVEPHQLAIPSDARDMGI